jgi:CrcB protein
MTILAVAAGGALGAVTRYLVAVRLYERLGVDFPWGTLFVNVVGSFFLGVVLALVEERGTLSPETRSFITVGFLGGLTTFSTFVSENWQYARDGDPLRLALYTGLSLVLGLAVFSAGHAGVVALER